LGDDHGMLHVFHMIDRAGAAELRERLRPEHKAYLAGVAERIAFAGRSSTPTARPCSAACS